MSDKELLEAAAAYLRSIGWRPVVASVNRIQAISGERNNFELVIRFTAAGDHERLVPQL